MIIETQLQKVILGIRILKKMEDKISLNKTIKVIEITNCSFANSQHCMFKIEILLPCFMMIQIIKDSKLHQLIKNSNHKCIQENNQIMRIKRPLYKIKM
jgi:hypothetical protein